MTFLSAASSRQLKRATIFAAALHVISLLLTFALMGTLVLATCVFFLEAGIELSATHPTNKHAMTAANAFVSHISRVGPHTWVGACIAVGGAVALLILTRVMEVMAFRALELIQEGQRHAYARTFDHANDKNADRHRSV